MSNDKKDDHYKRMYEEARIMISMHVEPVEKAERLLKELDEFEKHIP